MRNLGEALFFTVPLLSVGGLILGVAGWQIAIRYGGGEATGAPIRLRVDAHCDRAVIDARLDAFGLPASWEGDTLVVTGPGMPDDATHLPEALSVPGRLEVTVDGVVADVHVVNAGVQLALSGTPVTLLTLNRALPTRGVAMSIDGAPVDLEAVNGIEVQIGARASTPRDALRLATDRVVALRFPGVCVVRSE